jgi:predicted alpha/beta superfamily hydrolase
MFDLTAIVGRLGLAAVAIAGAQVMASATEPVAPTAVPSPKAEIWNSEQFVFRSAILGREMLIQVSKPLRPQVGPAPAVYLLDGNLIFPMVATTATLAANLNQLGPAYFVGIGYPEQDVGHWARERGRDLIHADLTGKPEASSTTFGEGARYERFLLEELRPLIEARYAVDRDRAILAGSSMGGLFATHILINNPRAFSDYLITSPSLWADPELVAAAGKLSPGKAGRVFIGVGADEETAMVRYAESLAAALRNGASGLEVEHWAVPGENHFSAAPALFRRAWKFLLPPLPKPVSAPSNVSKLPKGPGE